MTPATTPSSTLHRSRRPTGLKTTQGPHRVPFRPSAPRLGPGEEPDPELSVVVLTLDEEDNVEAAVRSLLEQRGVALEVLVVDSASTDDTVPMVRALAREDPRVRVIASRSYLSVGRARNIGLENARGRFVAFLSADATACMGWADAAVEALSEADVVYGHQEHAPVRRSVAAMVRGLRYHHFDQDHRLQPASFASNVNAAVRREVFRHVRYVDDAPAGALDDILFTREAQSLGYDVSYRNDMRVRHKDTVTFRQEWVKNRREGRGWGLLAPRLGLNRIVLGWGTVLSLLLVAMIAVPAWWSIALFLFVLYAPSLRRAGRGLRLARAQPGAWLGALAVSPVFDLAFFVSYLNGLRRRRTDLSGVTPQGA